jgi:adenine phosphoribosyltransferase
MRRGSYNMNFENYLSTYADFPKPGVQFWDFANLLAAPFAFKKAIQTIKAHFLDQQITHLAAIEAKGFTIGAALAYEMMLPLSLIRKPDLIPGTIRKARFIKEYGSGEYQLKSESIPETSRVLIVYDILASQGATKAAIELIETEGANVVGCAYIIELEYLAARKSLQNYDLFSLVKIQHKTLGNLTCN